MDEQKTEMLVGAAIVVAIVGAIAYAGRGSASSSGATFASANPQSVAAVENGVAASITAANQAVVQRAALASQTILGLASLQQQDHGAQLNAQTTQLQATETTKQVGLQANAATAAATAAAKAADYAAQQTTAQVQANAKAQVAVANNQTTQVQAQAGASKTASWLGAISNVVGSVLSFFNPAPQQQPTGTQVSYSPEVGPAPLAGIAA